MTFLLLLQSAGGCLPFLPSHMLHASDATTKTFLESYDQVNFCMHVWFIYTYNVTLLNHQYGDSFFDDVDEKGLTKVFVKVQAMVSVLHNSNCMKFRQKYGVESTDFFCGLGVLHNYYNYRSHGAPIWPSLYSGKSSVLIFVTLACTCIRAIPTRLYKHLPFFFLCCLIIIIHTCTYNSYCFDCSTVQSSLGQECITTSAQFHNYLILWWACPMLQGVWSMPTACVCLLTAGDGSSGGIGCHRAAWWLDRSSSSDCE